MFQRIQTIYLFLAVVALGIMFFLPIANYVTGDQTYVFDLMGLEMAGGDSAVEGLGFPLYIINLVIAAGALLTIFMFKNRQQQVKLGTINFLIALIFLIITYYFSTANLGAIPLAEGASGEVNLQSGFFMPLITMVCLFLANRGIRKDEALVKSLDRLR